MVALMARMKHRHRRFRRNPLHISIDIDIEQKIPEMKAAIVLYCGGGFRSALAAENLQKMGYTNVESMDGGWKGWVSAGLPTVVG